MSHIEICSQRNHRNKPLLHQTRVIHSSSLLLFAVQPERRCWRFLYYVLPHHQNWRIAKRMDVQNICFLRCSNVYDTTTTIFDSKNKYAVVIQESQKNLDVEDTNHRIFAMNHASKFHPTTWHIA